jgi:hypothetical protein
MHSSRYHQYPLATLYQRQSLAAGGSLHAYKIRVISLAVDCNVVATPGVIELTTTLQ